MKPRFRLLLPLLAIALGACAGQPAQPAGEPTSRDLQADRLLVTLAVQPPAGVASLSPSGRLDYQPPGPREVQERQLRAARNIAAELDLKLEEDWLIPALDIHCFVFRLADSNRQVDEIIAHLRGRADIDSVQPLQFFHGEAGEVMAAAGEERGDPLAGWNDTQHRKLLEAHRRSTGRSVTIAVIDAGVDVAHEDLQGAPLKIVDFVDGGEHAPGEAHGTAIVGLLSARPDNGIGIRGYAPDAEILLLRACWEVAAETEQTVCNSFTLAKALSFALESGAGIVNLSISGPRDPLLERLGAELVRRGRLVVAAGATQATFPASISGSVLASRYDRSLDGARALTLLPGNRYGFRNGTSVMTAKVSGAAALAKAVQADLSTADFERLLLTDEAPSAAGLPDIARLFADPRSSP